MICPRCGHSNKAKAVNCFQCSFALKTAPAKRETPAWLDGMDRFSKALSQFGSNWIALLFWLALLACTIVVWQVFQ
jgi:hypothetical protein